MDRSDWENACKDVNIKMLEFVKHFVTPVSKVLDKVTGEHHGSGSYIQIEDTKYLITNEHVASNITKFSLTYKYLNNENIFKITKPILTKPYPIDVALIKIEESAWNSCEHDSLAIPFDFFAPKHEPTERELLFILGFSGGQSSFYYNTLNTPSTPYLTQEVELPTNYGDLNSHFALHYKPDKAIKVDKSSRDLPNPPGLSGSLVWNTRYVEFYQTGKLWKPEDAQITGLIWGWPTSNACLIATKVELLDLDNIHRTSKKFLNNMRVKK